MIVLIDSDATDALKRQRALEILGSCPSKPLREVAREVGMPESTLRGVKRDYEASKLSVQHLPIDLVRTDGETQTRAAMVESRVADYAEDLELILARHPLIVFHDGEFHWLSDGFHRLAAARVRGLDAVPCEVRPGTRRDALRFALGANADHGLFRSAADKRNAVAIVLVDPEWQSLSDAAVAAMTSVSSPLVARVRRELAATITGLGSATRTTANGRVMDTTNLGRKPKAAEDRGGQKDEDEPDDGREPGSDDDKGNPVVVEVAGDPEPDPTQAYLATFKIRDHLTMSCRAVFDRDALAYRRAAVWLAQGKALGLAATRTGENQGAWMFQASRFLRLDAPHDWLRCTTCNGGHKAVEGGCSTCYGRGYVVS